MADLYGLSSFCLLGLVLCIGAVTDCKTGKIPNRLTYPAIVAGCVLALIFGGLTGGPAGAWEGLKMAVFALALAAVPFFLFFLAGGLGGGDVKLMAAVGAISAQWQCVLGTAIYAFAFGLLFAIVLMVRKGIVLQTLRRVFTAAFAAAFGIKTPLPTDSPRIPFGLAICLGGLCSGAEHLLKLRLPWSAWWG